MKKGRKMRRERKLSLTFSGSYCVNPSCQRPLYVELMTDEFDECCYECWSDRPFPPLVLLQGGQSMAAIAHIRRLKPNGTRE